MTDRLKPCPFCGGELRRNKWGLYQHERNECVLTCFDIGEEDFEKWNTRKSMDRIVEQLEEAKGKPYTDGVHAYNENDFIDIDKAIEIVKEGDKK